MKYVDDTSGSVKYSYFTVGLHRTTRFMLSSAFAMTVTSSTNETDQSESDDQTGSENEVYENRSSDQSEENSETICLEMRGIRYDFTLFPFGANYRDSAMFSGKIRYLKSYCSIHGVSGSARDMLLKT